MWSGAVLLNHALDCQPAYAQTATPAQKSDQPSNSTPAGGSNSIEDLVRRMQTLERQNAELADHNRSLTHQLDKVTRQYDELNKRLDQIEPGAKPRTPPFSAASVPSANSTSNATAPRSLSTPDLNPIPDLGDVLEQGPTWDSASLRDNPRPPTAADFPSMPRFMVGGYDDDLGAFVLVRPFDPQETPFELRVDFINQARFTDFDRSVKTWTDSTGARLPVNNYNSVEVTRNFIQFQGFALDPRLQFTSILFSSTAFNDTVFLGWMNYHFNDAFDLRIGNWLVPGTREWLEGFRWTLGAERLMATTFFRPNISPGIWALGEPIANLHYVVMYANSLNRFNQGVERIGPGGAFGGSVWWEPMGRFGLGASDNEFHEQWTPRIGTSLAVSRETNQGFASPETGNPEDTILRLSDGTSLFRPGALGPNVLLSSAAVQVWTIDAAVKYRGFGLSTEYFLRWIDGFDTHGGQPAVHSLFDYGALAQAGYYVLPKKLETFARSSFVNGRFGGGYEVGGGVNWYVRGRRECRLTFEVLEISHSPAQNVLTGYRAGESGTLFQLQWLVDF
jgi:hypothetical protein